MTENLLVDYGFNSYLFEPQDNSTTMLNGTDDASVAFAPPYTALDEFEVGERCMNVDFGRNFSYLNVSCEVILEYSVPLYGFCMPFLLFTTVTANSLIVVVLSKRNMATPTNSVLMGK